MATRTFGTLKEFNPDAASIKTYLKRSELYFTANTVAAAKQVPILLSAIGSSTYTLLSDLLAPDAPKDKSLGEITAALKKHFEPKRPVIAERFHFHKRNQAMGESIAEYDAALRKLATHCKFGNYLKDALRDRFVCGLRNEAIQKRLLTDTELTLTSAMELTQGMETAEHNTRSFKREEPAIKRLSGRQFHGQGKQQPCYRCGKTNHTAPECRFKDAECHACGKKGHIAPACRSKPQAKSNPAVKKYRKKPHGTNLVQRETADSTDSETEEFHLIKLKEPASNPVHIPVQVEGKSLIMELDTGAAVSIISETTRKEMFPNSTLHKSKLTLKTYTDEPMQITGQLNVHVQYGSQSAPLVLVVVAGNGPSLLGINPNFYTTTPLNLVTIVVHCDVVCICRDKPCIAVFSNNNIIRYSHLLLQST